MDVCFNFIRDVIVDGTLTVTKIETLVNPDDTLTKSVLIKKFEEALNYLRMLRD